MINERINKIINNEKYKEYLQRTEEAENHREFCKHNIEHFLDVCRIGYIISLENGINFKKDIIYAVGLLHDIGRFKQYEEGTPHNIASVELALPILKESGYEDDEIEEITSAIEGHRTFVSDENSLQNIMYRADKLSRKCFRCSSSETCNWSYEKRNMIITY